MTQQV